MTATNRMREDLASAVEQAHMLASSAQLWPGWDISGTPLVLHSPEIAYIIGHPSPPEGYEETGAVADRTVFAGKRLPEMAANTARRIAGVLCALIMFPSAPLTDSEEFVRLILHECFHAYQRQGLSRVGLPDWTVMGRYPESDPENNAMSIVENRILCSALKGERQALAAAKFLAVRQARHRYLDEIGLTDIPIYEQGSEFNEGTPTYVELKAGKPLGDLIDSLEKANVAGKWAISRRFYFTGAAIALRLDALMPGWHGRLADAPTNVVIVKPSIRFHPTITGLRSASGLVVDIARLCLEDVNPHRLVVRLPEAPEIHLGEPFSLSGEAISMTAARAVVEGPGPDGGYKVRFPKDCHA